MRRIRFTLLGIALLLAACESQAPAPVYFGHLPPSQTPSGMAPAAPVSSNPPASQVVVAPPVATVAGAITVAPGDTVYGLARRHNIPVRALIDANNLQPPFALAPGQVLQVPAERFHTVQRGETLYAISRAYGTDVYALAQANGLQPPYGITVGQALRVPSSGTAVATAAPVPQGVTPTIVTVPAGGSAPPVASVPYPSAAPPTSSGGGVTMQELPPPSAAPSPAPPQQSAAPAPAPQAPMPQAPTSQAPVAPAPPAATEAPSAPAPASEPAPQVASAPAAPPPVTDPEPAARSGRTFAWPVRGRILSNFGPKPDGLHNDGINIAARAGAPVIAAENGVVVYSGSELRGFGNLLLVRHADGYITAYAHLDKVLARKGQSVKRGQAIGTVGTSGGVDQPQLHFEIRRGTQAVDPAKLLSIA